MKLGFLPVRGLPVLGAMSVVYFLAMPKVNKQVAMKVCWFGLFVKPVPMPIGFLGLGELSPVDDNLHGHGHIPIRYWAITGGSVL